MDSMSAFAMGAANRGKELMVFDWVRAVEIINARNALDASAGLAGDWEWTGGSILRNGRPVPSAETYTHLASTWATPELEVDGETIPCYRMEGETPGWDAATYWPPEAIAALEIESINGKEADQ